MESAWHAGLACGKSLIFLLVFSSDMIEKAGKEVGDLFFRTPTSNNIYIYIYRYIFFFF